MRPWWMDTSHQASLTATPTLAKRKRQETKTNKQTKKKYTEVSQMRQRRLRWPHNRGLFIPGRRSVGGIVATTSWQQLLVLMSQSVD